MSTSEVSKLLDQVEGAVSTRNGYRSPLGAVYKWAAKRGDLPGGSDPTQGLYQEPKNARIRWLNPEERRKLLAAAEGQPDLDLMIRIAITTGMRKGEILKMRWRDLDFETTGSG